MRDFGKYKSYRVNQGKLKHLKAIATSCKIQMSSVNGKLSNPRVFFLGISKLNRKCRYVACKYPAKLKRYCVGYGALCALKHICVAFFALKFSLAGVEPVMFHQDLRQLGANGYSGCSFASRRRAKLFIAP